MTITTLPPLDLAALLCSRVCHDVISPVGAIINGLEVLEGEDDEDMRNVAMELIKKSAVAASARLQFCRLAFGASGSLGAMIDTGDAEAVARSLLANERTSLSWVAARRLAPKNVVKLLLNLCLIAAASIPRGGRISVFVDEEGGATTLKVEGQGTNARLPRGVADILARAEIDTVDAHSVQPYYTLLLSDACAMALRTASNGDTVTLTAAALAKAETQTGPTQAEASAPV